MRVVFLGLLLTANASAIDSQERLTQLGRIWVDTKYFHPALAREGIDWEAAGIRAVAKVRVAASDKEYADAINSMLGELDDSTTRVHAPSDSDAAVLSTREEDGILIVTIRVPSDVTRLAQAQKDIEALLDKLSQAKAVILDLRSESKPEMRYFFDYPQSLISRLIREPLMLPGSRSRMHSGYGGGGSFFYYGAFQVRAGRILEPSTPAMSGPVVFLVNRDTSLPSSVVAIQRQGRAAVVHEGEGNASAAGESARYNLGGRFTASVRLDELLMPDGTGIPPPTLRTALGQGLSEALRIARDARFQPTQGERLPATPVWRTERWNTQQYPSVEERVLAAYEVWGVFEYFFAYRNLMDGDWYVTLKEFLPRFQIAKDAREYFLALAEMTARTGDSHVNVNSAIQGEIFGDAIPGLTVRKFAKKWIVTAVAPNSTGIEAGDVLLTVDGKPIAEREREIARYTAASTPQSLNNRIANRLLAGAEGSKAEVTVEKSSGTNITAGFFRSRSNRQWSPRKGDAIRMLTGNIGYVDLTRISVAEVDAMFDRFRGTKAIVFDMRGYPRGTAWSIAPRLTETTSPPAATFRRPLRLAPSIDIGDSIGARGEQSFRQTIPPTDKWRYKQPTVMLIDERAISQSEHSGLFYRAANRTKFIGTPTTGANGDVTAFSVPGGIRISFSGHDVRHVDDTQLQRVGLKPDILVEPTPEGLRAGRDEVLDRAIEYINSGK